MLAIKNRPGSLVAPAMAQQVNPFLARWASSAKDSVVTANRWGNLARPVLAVKATSVNVIVGCVPRWLS